MRYELEALYNYIRLPSMGYNAVIGKKTLPRQ